MRELWQLTKLIRSKNAGPFELTFDIMFEDREGYDRVLKSRVLSPEAVARMYGVKPDEVRFFEIEQILTIKFSIPRKVFSGDVMDTDVYGGQFHGPLVRLRVEEDQ
jgi:Domain of unknown function (DUF4387)